MSNALNNAAKLRPIFNVKEPRFGAKGDDTTDDTAALQAAIDAAEAVGGRVEVPWGTYIHTGLTISDNITLAGWEQTSCVLKMKNSTNADSITIGVTVQNPIIETLTIEGNRSNNTTSGHGIYLPDNPEPDATVSYGFSVVLRNVYVQNVRDTSLYVGVNRNVGHVENSEFKRGGRCVYIEDSSDWRFMHGRFAFPLTTHAIEIDGGADNVFMGGSAFGATLAACIKIDSPGSSPTKLIGMTINANSQDGVHIVGFSGASRTIGHQIIGCWFETNGLGTTNTYSDIVLEDTRDAVLVGNYFRYPGSGNRPAYLVEFVGTASRCQWGGNSYDDSVNVPYATAVSNTPTLLHTRAQALYSDSVCYLGGAGTAYSAYIGPGVSGGNYVQIQGRASGTGPDITAQGVDTNVTFRLSSKGTGSVEVMTGALGRRVARFIDVASSVNYFDFTPSATGNAVRLTANGSDTDVDLTLAPKGGGNVLIPIANVPNFTSDANAAAGGVPVGGIYRNGSALQVRAS